ncbi:MAG: AzlD domain-containing protein [Halarchaeum sp.]
MTTYDATTVWALVAAVGVLTFLVRFSFVGLLGRFGDVPPWAERALGFVPVAVFAALVVPAVVTVRPTVTGTLTDDRTVAAAAAAVVAWRTENVLATIAAGMAALWTLRFVLPVVV